MSTILKALRRLEEEKRSRQPTSLEEDVLASAGPAPASPRRWALTLGIATGASLVVVLLLGAVFYMLPPAGQRASQAPPRAAATPATSETSERAEPEPAPASAPPAVAAAPLPPAPLPQAAPVPRVEPAVEPLRPTASAGSPPDASAAAAAPPVAPFSVAAPRAKSVDAVVAEAPSQPFDEPGPEPVDLVIEPPAVPVEPEPEPAPVVAAVEAPVAPVVEKPPPSRAEAEVVQRRNTPSLRVTRTVWHPNPDRREAVVELPGRAPLRLSEGDVVAGYTIVEIGLADVELERDGVIVERRVGAR